ncbi:hypothetical protein BVG19_g5652 [[Candida] boidinii]|nr:hypothetical protein BVG19_g5652 [[Candida] boidinii]OWB53549.1 N-acetylglucosamine-6-phosphate deacetylase activity protein [[Candida] boidinii]
MSIVKFTNCYLCDRGELNKRDLYIDTKSGKIISEPIGEVEIKETDLLGQVLAPGFIDIQINGCYGFDYSHYESEEQYTLGYNKCMKNLLKTGTTSMCPTMITSTNKMYNKVLPHLSPKRVNDKCESLGAHLEGPFISLKKSGCHERKNITTAKEGFKSIRQMYGDDFTKHVRIVTGAPEVEGMLEMIPKLTEEGVVYSIGHTAASFDIAVEAVKKGASMVTHMYNAMPQPHHREPGVVGLAAYENSPYFGVIADGIHVHKAAAALLYHSTPDKFCLVTDAMNLMGLPDGSYKWEQQTINKDGFVLKLKGTDTIAGSATELPSCVQNLMSWAEIPLEKAVQTVTNNPARSVFAEDRKGFLDVGCDADLTVLNSSGKVLSVYKLGNEVYQAPTTSHL